VIYRLGSRCIETQGAEFYVAPSADVIGSVRLGRWASVWFGAVLRGDCDWIELGEGTNVQDGSVLHTDPGRALSLGDNVTVGHLVHLHTCTIGNDCLIGNGAMVLDRAVIGSETIVAARTLIPPDKVIPSGVVIMGSPAKVVRELTDKDRERVRRASQHYVQNAKRYRDELAGVNL